MVYYDLPPGESAFSRTVVTIGNFDGVHLGHRAILARVRQRARELGGQAVAVTFNPHPVKVLRPEVQSAAAHHPGPETAAAVRMPGWMRWWCCLLPGNLPRCRPGSL